jgi:hypothetical protein
MRRSIKEAAVGVRVKFIKIKRLSKGSTTLSEETTESDGPPGGILRDWRRPPTRN